MTTTTIRQVEADDYDNGVLELLSQLSQCDKSQIRKDQFASQIDLMSRCGITTFVYCVDSKIVGTASIIIEPKLIHNLSFVGHIEDVVVDKDYRNQGIGQKLIEHLSNFARGKCCYKVILDCSNVNSKFYEKSGFKVNGLEMRQNLQ